MRIALWLIPFKHVLAIVKRHTAQQGAPPRLPMRLRAPHWPVEPEVDAVLLAARFVPFATCLTQALSCQFLLSRRGLPTTLRIGAFRVDGRFKAHAWLESAGRVLIGEVDQMHAITPLPFSS